MALRVQKIEVACSPLTQDLGLAKDPSEGQPVFTESAPHFDAAFQERINRNV